MTGEYSVLHLPLPPLHGMARKAAERLMPLIGTRFGRWTVLSVGRVRNQGGFSIQARCDCGTVRVLIPSSVFSGNSNSCGCLHRELTRKINFKHGKTESREFGKWQGMIARCENPKCPQFKNYGKRGISVCSRWRKSFASFFLDMGPVPSRNHSLDRINVNGNYEPGNCRWATWTEQARNKRNNSTLSFRGKTQCLAAWCEELHITLAGLKRRMRAGLPIDKILTPRATVSGVPGVSWNTKAGKWRALVVRGGVPHYLGIFIHKANAVAAVDEFVRKCPDGRSRNRGWFGREGKDPDSYGVRRPAPR